MNKTIIRKRKNRTTKARAGRRDFICGCGKAYLSYPALYTHIKQKHKSIAPPGTTKTSSKIGRPPVKISPP